LSTIKSSNSQAEGKKHFENFSIDVADMNNEVITRVTKTIYIKKQPKFAITLEP
jgi:hypothetical protein